MGEFWDDAFHRNALMWGLEPTASAVVACDYFAQRGVQNVLIPGIGYGRNAKPFLERGMRVTGIEISEGVSPDNRGGDHSRRLPDPAVGKGRTADRRTRHRH